MDRGVCDVVAAQELLESRVPGGEIRKGVADGPMTSLLDGSAVPWALPAAPQLVQALCELYPEPYAAIAVAESVDIQRFDLPPNLPVRELWREILRKAAPRRKLRAIVERVLADNPDGVRSEFLNALLTSEAETIAVDARPPTQGDSAFLGGSEKVSRNEALLFHDDLSLKIGRLEWLREALARVGARASAVCKIVATGPTGTQNATGFLIGPRLILTNWHVVEDEGFRAYLLQVLFGYDDDGKGGHLTAAAGEADMTSVAGNAADDWAIFRLAGDPPPDSAVIKLSEAASAEVGQAAFIVQHPGGDTKRIAYARNTVTEIGDRVVHYLSDTMAGSSGSPVFNDAGRIVALHHAGGEPQKIAGKPPIVKNEGIRIQRVIEQMNEMGLEFA